MSRNRIHGSRPVFSRFLRDHTRLLLRVPPIRKGVDSLGIRSWYERRVALENLTEPMISADASYDAGLGLLSLRGSWRAMGAKLARVTPLLRAAEDARDYRASVCQTERAALDAMTDDAIEHLRAAHGDVAALIEGSADVLEGVELRDVILANVWPSIVLWREYARSCGAFVVRSRSGPIMGQNLDLGPTNNVVVVHVMPEHGAARLCHLVPGSLWLGMGVNQFGVTIGGGSVNVARPFSPLPGSLPTSFSHIGVLGAARSASAAGLTFASAAPFGPTHDGVSLVATDPTGTMSRIEATGYDVSVSRVQRPLVAATNHFTLDDMHNSNRCEDDVSRAILNNSIARVARVEQEIVPESVSAKDVRGFLRNGRGRGAWRRSAAAPDTGWTTASYVIDLAQMRYHYWLGTRPSKAKWRELDLEPLLRGRTYD